MKPSQNYEFAADETRKTITLILAGGRGSRLIELTDWRVKPALSFGDNIEL